MTDPTVTEAEVEAARKSLIEASDFAHYPSRAQVCSALEAAARVRPLGILGASVDALAEQCEKAEAERDEAQRIVGGLHEDLIRCGDLLRNMQAERDEACERASLMAEARDYWERRSNEAPAPSETLRERARKAGGCKYEVGPCPVVDCQCSAILAALTETRDAALAEALRKVKPMSTFASDVLVERERQKSSERFGTTHDDRHVDGELALAAACYAISGIDKDYLTRAIKWLWPWDRAWWKPKDRRRDLVRAGALIIAEGDRLDRKGSSHE